MSRQARVDGGRNDLNSFQIREAYGPSSSTTSLNSQSHQQRAPPIQAGEIASQSLDTVFALYDFVSVDRPHSLPLARGDIISVYSKLASGWWEGVNSRGQRGWFPSNYTQSVSQDEINRMRAESMSRGNIVPTPDNQDYQNYQQQQSHNQSRERQESQNYQLEQSSRQHFGQVSVGNSSSEVLRANDGSGYKNSNTDSIDPLSSTPSLELTPNINDFAVAVDVGADEDYINDEYENVYGNNNNDKDSNNNNSNNNNNNNNNNNSSSINDRFHDSLDDQTIAEQSSASSYHDASRKGSAVSYNSSIDRPDAKLPPISMDRTAAEAEYNRNTAQNHSNNDSLDGYKLVDTTSDSYQHTPSHWIPHISNGQLSFANTSRMHTTNDLPFEAVDMNNESEIIPKTMPVPNDILEHSYNDSKVPVLNDQSETYLQSQRQRSSRSSLDSKTSNSFTIQESQTWSGLLNHLKSAIQSLSEVYGKWDEPGLAGRYNDVANTIQTINLMAGIPPGSLPSAVTSREIATLFRRIMNNLSKTGLICDICSIRRTASRRPSATSSVVSEGTSDQSNYSFISSEDFTDMCNALLKDAEKFIQSYKELLKSEHGQVDDEDKIETPPTVYNVKQYKDGMWVNVNYPNQHQPSVGSESASLHSAATGAGSVSGAGLGITTSPRRTIFQLESFDASVPMDVEAVSGLEEKLSILVGNIDNVKNVINSPTSSTGQTTIDQVQDRKKRLQSNLHHVSNTLSIVLNLVESLDLSIYYGGRRRTLLHKSARAPPTRDAFECLKLLYDFLDAKQAMYDALLGITDIMTKSIGASNDFIATLSEQMEQVKIVELLMVSESGVETKVQNLIDLAQANMNKTVEVAGTLAEERTTMINHSQSSLLSPPSSVNSSQHPSSGPQAPAQYQPTPIHPPPPQQQRPSLTDSYSDNVTDLRSQGGSTAATPAASAPTPTRQASNNTDITSMGSSRDESQPWYLQLDYGEEMVYDRQGEPRGGTIRALVEQLTHHNRFLPDFNNAMLLTFRSFSDANELFDLLRARFYLQPPEGLTTEEFQAWKEKKQTPVRLRVVNILKSWLEFYWLEDDVDETAPGSGAAPSSSSSSRMSTNSVSTVTSRNALLEEMLTFANNLKAQKFNKADALISLIEQRLKLREPSFQRRLKPNPEPKPEPHVPKNLKKFKVTDIDILEMARQLCLREFNLYKVITPQECLNRGCSSRSKAAGSGAQSHRIGDFIHNSNHLTNWVSSVILKNADPKKRAVSIKYFVDVASKCRDLNNFSSMTAIISSLFSSTIHRMKKTWDLVPPKTVSVLDSLSKLMNSSRNFNEYRDLLSLVPPPCVPFFGVYLTDLTFTEDGNPDFLQKESRIINFAKRAKLASTIESIRMFQRMPYNFEEIPEIQEMMRVGFELAPPIEEQYDTSLTMEPKSKPGTDKVAMLLQENGIL